MGVRCECFDRWQGLPAQCPNSSAPPFTRPRQTVADRRPCPSLLFPFLSPGSARNTQAFSVMTVTFWVCCWLFILPSLSDPRS